MALPSRRSLLAQFGILAAGAAGAWFIRDRVLWSAPEISFSPGLAWSGWLPFPAERRVIIVEVAVDGTPVKALIDSGAQSSAVDLALVQRLGLAVTAMAPVVAFGVSGAAQIGRAASLNVQAGDLTLRRLKAAALQLGPITQTGVSLILGQDVLRHLLADIDFPNGRIAFRDAEAFVAPAGAIQAPARVQGRALSTVVAIESSRLDVVVDTGASSALALSSDTAQTLGLLSGEAAASTPSIIFGGVSHDRVVNVDSVEFAGQLYQDVPVQVFTSQAVARVPKGLLGVGLLDRFRVFLDLGHGKLSLLPEADSDLVRAWRRRPRVED